MRAGPPRRSAARLPPALGPAAEAARIGPGPGTPGSAPCGGPILIDLHLHTTASDGLDSPDELVHIVARAGVRVLAVTDHDTVEGLADVARAAAGAGLGWVPGIEVTAVEDGRDVHVLGYGFDPASLTLAAFLQAQRQSRLERIREFGARFEALGLPIDVNGLLKAVRASGGRSLGRAHISRLLVSAGHVASVDEAFSEWLAPGRPGFVPRHGAPVVEVVAQIRGAGGVASLAHPGLLHDDTLVGRVLGSGFLAIEAYHTDHDEQTTAHYLAWGTRAGLAVSGGSDYHGESSKRRGRPGEAGLPVEAYRLLRQRATEAGCAWVWPEVAA